ncbi:MAG: hypothetical protein NT166_24825 [Candidatus Aminicenantes bacterium]|nr:hypothetical protein [Candidatus Aminicenantes bacterium]
MGLKAKTEQNQALCRETKSVPFFIDNEPKMTDKDIYFLQRAALLGYIMYLIGLFLPYYRSIDTFKLGIDVLFLGDLYLWMLIVVAIVSGVGIARKKNYFRWIIPNSIFCTIEILIRIIFLHFKLVFRFSMFLGIGYYFIIISAVIIWFSIISYLVGMHLNKQQKKTERGKCIF